MVRIKLRGLDGIDHRTSAARALLQWREQVISDCGGLESLSATKLALIDAASRTKALLDHADSFLIAERSVINRKQKAFIPLVAQRQSLCDSLCRTLVLLGLQRVPKAIPSLREYIEQRETRPRADEPEPEEIDRDKEPPEAGA
jgi:hypothetical protein